MYYLSSYTPYTPLYTLLYRDELADWYVEISKTRMKDPTTAKQARRVLTYVWDTCLRLLHPYTPYITETLWQQLPQTTSSIMTTDWPLLTQQPTTTTSTTTSDVSTVEKWEESTLALDDSAAKTFLQLQRLIRGIRNIRAEYKTEPGRRVPATIRISTVTDEGKLLYQACIDELAAVSLLARLEEEKVYIIEVSQTLTEVSFSAPSEVFAKSVQVLYYI